MQANGLIAANPRSVPAGDRPSSRAAPGDGQARSAALFQLATELPAALLARMLGIHIDVAVAGQRASSGDWMTYAADISRRPRQDEPSPSPSRPLETEAP
jgi:hypothetical protein